MIIPPPPPPAQIMHVECPAEYPVVADRLPVRDLVPLRETCQATMRDGIDRQGQLTIAGSRGTDYWYQVNGGGHILTLGYARPGEVIRFTIPRGDTDLTFIGDRYDRPYEVTVRTTR
jgi:hypothetical protein